MDASGGFTLRQAADDIDEFAENSTAYLVRAPARNPSPCRPVSHLSLTKDTDFWPPRRPINSDESLTCC